MKKLGLSYTQEQTLKKLLNEDYETVLTTSGYAFWNVHVRESQGRTFENKLKKKDVKFFLENGLVVENDGIELTEKGEIIAIDLQIKELHERKGNAQVNNFVPSAFIANIEGKEYVVFERRPLTRHLELELYEKADMIHGVLYNLKIAHRS